MAHWRMTRGYTAPESLSVASLLSHVVANNHHVTTYSSGQLGARHALRIHLPLHDGGRSVSQYLVVVA